MADEPSIEETIVTATRVESSLKDTAIAVSAFTTATMGDMILTGPIDYEALTPDTRFAVNALYTINTGAGEFALGGTWSYVGERYMNIFNSPELKSDAYKRLDLSVTWTSNSTHWQVKGWVKNATDEEWFNTLGVGRNSNPADGRYPAVKYLRYSGNPAEPRMYLIEPRYRI